MSRISELDSEIPNNPDRSFNSVITSSAVIPSFSIKNGTIAGSTSPARVPIVKPVNGVKPIELSNALPSLIAATDAPLPKCNVMIFNSFNERLSNSAVRSAK